MKRKNKKILNRLQRIPFDKNEYPFGINLIGHIQAQTGEGEGCRLLARALEKTDIPFGIINLKSLPPYYKDNKLSRKKIANAKYNINIIHCNPQKLSELKQAFPQTTWDKRYNIGFWLCSDINNVDCFDNVNTLLDEIWVPSNYCAEILKNISLPIKIIPYGTQEKRTNKYDRKHFKIPNDKFVFLIMFDAKNSIERKNPFDAIDAYKRAFKKQDNSVSLIITIRNPTNEVISKIKSHLDGYKNILILDKTLSKNEISSLINIVNVFLSLHKNDSFGFVIAQAMLSKTPIIATYCSGSADLMTPETACCIDNKLESSENHQETISPDIIQASVFMKILKVDKQYRDLIAGNAYKFITKNNSIEKCANIINDTIKRINDTK